MVSNHPFTYTYVLNNPLTLTDPSGYQASTYENYLKSQNQHAGGYYYYRGDFYIKSDDRPGFDRYGGIGGGCIGYTGGATYYDWTSGDYFLNGERSSFNQVFSPSMFSRQSNTYLIGSGEYMYVGIKYSSITGITWRKEELMDEFTLSWMIFNLNNSFQPNENFVLNDRDVMANTADGFRIGSLSKIANKTSIGASGIQNTLRSTKIGSDIAYQLSYSKLFIQGSRLLKPLGYAGLFIGTPADMYLSLSGQQSWSTTGLNFTISTTAIAIGGWYGLGLGGMYMFGQVGYDLTMEGLEKGVIKPNPDFTRNYIPGLAPTPVIY